MRIKITCSSCGAAFTLTEGVLTNSSGYSCCPSCARCIPSGAISDAQKLYKFYSSFNKELEENGFRVKSLKLSKKASEE